MQLGLECERRHEMESVRDQKKGERREALTLVEELVVSLAELGES